jgi:hypothetical protein
MSWQFQRSIPHFYGPYLSSSPDFLNKRKAKLIFGAYGRLWDLLAGIGALKSFRIPDFQAN